MTYDQELIQEILWELREIKKLLTPREPVQAALPPEMRMELTPAQIKELQRELLKLEKLDPKGKRFVIGKRLYRPDPNDPSGRTPDLDNPL